MTFPCQPLIVDKHGTIRFEANRIVKFLLDDGHFDMNHLALMHGAFRDKDWEQFAMLIGYSTAGFADLSYVSDEISEKVDKESDNVRKRRQRNMEW